MELFEKINRSFGTWYEGLFGGSDDVRPKDILRRIFVAMEENRKEHLDDKVYVPNHYILEIAVDDDEEKEYLRSFLVREELETAIRRYCKQNNYQVRGGLEFTIREVDVDPEQRRREKVRVRARYDSRLATAPSIAPDAPAAAADARRPIVDEENATVYDVNHEDDEPGTVPAVVHARLRVSPPTGTSFDYTVARSAVTIGRSPKAGNDIVVDDEKMSRRHARLELEPDGRFTVYDLDTTNGTRVNGRKVDNATLRSGDEIGIGDTRVMFQCTGDDAAGTRSTGWRQTAAEDASAGAPRLVLLDGDEDVEQFILSSDTLIGRAATNDIVLNDRSVGTRHAQIRRSGGSDAAASHTLQVLDQEHMTLHNGSQIMPGTDVRLSSGDRVGLGTVTLRFEEGSR